MTNGSLLKVESIAECSLGAFCNTFDLHYAIIGLENQFRSFFEWLLKTGFTVPCSTQAPFIDLIILSLGLVFDLQSIEIK